MPSSMDLPDLGKEPRSSMSPALAGRFFSTSTTGFLGGSGVKNLPVKNLLLQEMQETRAWSQGREDPLKEGNATHSSILAWRTLMERGAWWATSTGSQRVRYDWGDLACAYIYIRSNQSVLKKINSEYSSNIHRKDWYWSWSSNTLATWCQESIHWKRSPGVGKDWKQKQKGWQRMRWLDSITVSMGMN